MSAHAITRPTATSSPPRTDFWRLTKTELRKMVDTRAGSWLLLGVALIVIATVAISLLTGDATDHTMSEVFANAIQPSALLLPLVGVLLVSSEWSQRTAVVTFALVPSRGRVLASKVAAGLLLSLAAVLLTRIACTIGVALNTGGLDGDAFDLELVVVAQSCLFVASGMLAGLAFGAVFLASAPAIVLFFVLPTAFNALGQLSFFEGIARWTDQGATMVDLPSETISATDWAQVGTSMVVWVLIPALIGIRRVQRAEVG